MTKYEVAAEAKRGIMERDNLKSSAKSVGESLMAASRVGRDWMGRSWHRLGVRKSRP